MGFFGGFEWETNPELPGAMADFDAGIAEYDGAKSAGNRFYRNILKGLMRGDTSGIGNPFAAQRGGNDRLAAARMDTLNLPPEIALARRDMQLNRNQEQEGINFENYVRGMAVPAAEGNMAYNKWKVSGKAGMYGDKGRARLGGVQGRETKGWGDAVLGLAGAAGSVMTGLGAMKTDV